MLLVGNSPTGRGTSCRLALETFSFISHVGNSPTGRGTSCRLALETFSFILHVGNSPIGRGTGCRLHYNRFQLCYLLVTVLLEEEPVAGWH